LIREPGWIPANSRLNNEYSARIAAKGNAHLAIPDRESRSLTVTSLWSVIPGKNHDLSVTTEHESAAIESGATDASRPAGFIRACRLLLHYLRIPLRHGKVVPRRSQRTRSSTDEPSAHPWHQISNICCTKGRDFQVKSTNPWTAQFPQIGQKF
jgi:hypothetical protein